MQIKCFIKFCLTFKDKSGKITPLYFLRKVPKMAKKTAIKIKLEGSNGYFYTAKKNPKTHTEKIKRKKYNPKTRQHEEFVEKKIK